MSIDEFPEAAVRAAMRPVLVFVIQGRPQVKKNSKRVIRDRRGQTRVVSSDEYHAWEQAAVLQLRAQWRNRPPLEGLWNASIVSYLGARQRPDASNLYEGPQDALQLAGVFHNDSQIVSHDGSRRRRDNARPRVEVYLTPAEGDDR